jgi:hypothetical protein
VRRAAIVLLGALLAGCSLFHGDYPGGTCSSNLDCFSAQGEVCNLGTKQCVVLDAGYDAPPPPDAGPDAPPPPDSGPDADLPDADLTPDADLADGAIDAT